MEGETIRIAYACDRNYISYLKKSMESIKKYNKNVDFIVLTADKELEIPEAKTFIFNPNSDLFKFRHNDRMGDGVYYKLYLPLLPYDKILFIDCDVICQRPLKELWETPCDFICATQSHSYGKEQAKQLNLPKYFLSAVMLMNLEELRKQKFIERCLERLKNMPNVPQHDETLINLEFNSQIKEIDKKFDYCKDRKYDEPISETDAYLLHYIGSDKSPMLRRTNFDNLDILKNSAKDKSIAIVGNSEKIFDTNYGQEIDNHDIIIRFNKGFPIKPESQGTRTDILFLACTLKDEELYKFKTIYTVRRSNFCGTKCMFELNPQDNYQLQQVSNDECDKRKLKYSQPSTGFIAINFALSTECKSIDLYGFDGFKNATYYNPKGYKTLHNGNKEIEKILEYQNSNLLKIHS